MAQGIKNAAPCSVDGCDTSIKIRLGLCVKHYYRFRKYGDPVAAGMMAQYRKDDPARPQCKAAGCDASYIANGWCKKHYHRVEKYGHPEGGVFHQSESMPCRVCHSEPRADSPYREYCSKACRHASFYYGTDDLPQIGNCLVCGCHLEFFSGEGPARRYRRSNWCAACRRRVRLRAHALSPTELAERDGLLCSICTEPVDLTLRRRDLDGLWMGSVDHHIPLARGGTNDADNLRLTHLLCNIKKKATLPVVA